MFKKLLKKIKEYDTIIIHRHSRPDGDALGSQIGLYLVLKDTFKNKKVLTVGDANPRLSFIGSTTGANDEDYKDALVIICDVAVSSMVSDDRYKLAKEIYIIDHHHNLSDIEDNNLLIDPTRASCAEIVADFVMDSKLKISKDAATALFTGIVTDSGRFQYSDTSAKTLYTAAKLLELGAKATSIYDKLYVETLESKKLKAIFTERMQTTEHNVAYLKNTKEDLEKYNIDFNTASRGMVAVMAGIEGINIWANFTFDEEKGKYIGEFRSRGFSIVDIAKKYGGGGHDQACGATMEDESQIELILNDFDKRMEKFINETNSKTN